MSRDKVVIPDYNQVDIDIANIEVDEDIGLGDVFGGVELHGKLLNYSVQRFANYIFSTCSLTCTIV